MVVVVVLVVVLYLFLVLASLRPTVKRQLSYDKPITKHQCDYPSVVLFACLGIASAAENNSEKLDGVSHPIHVQYIYIYIYIYIYHVCMYVCVYIYIRILKFGGSARADSYRRGVRFPWTKRDELKGKYILYIEYMYIYI